MDVSAIRLANLKSIVAARTSKGSTKKDAAVELDMSASFLSQLLAGKRMGDELARKIEVTLSLPHGWMDRLSSQSSIREPIAEYLSQTPRLEANILASALKLIRLACENLELDFDAEDPADAGLVLMACDYLSDRGDSAVTADNVVDFTKRLRASFKEKNAQSASADDRRAGRRTG